MPLVEFLAARAVPGIEEVVGTTYRRTLRLAHGTGVAELTPQADHVRAVLRLDDLRDLTTAVQRCRRVFDLDADPQAVAELLGRDRHLGKLVSKSAGVRLPGTVDGFELATRAVLGQQVSVAAARTLAGRLVAAHGTPLASPDGGLTHLFPQAQDVADVSLSAVGMPADAPSGAQRAGLGRRDRRGRDRCRRRSHRDDGEAARHPRRRSVDRGVHHDARPGRSRCLPADRPRRAARARASRPSHFPARCCRGCRTLASMAVVRRHAPLEVFVSPVRVTNPATTATVATACGPFTIVMRDDKVIASGWTTALDELMQPVPRRGTPE